MRPPYPAATYVSNCISRCVWGESLRRVLGDTESTLTVDHLGVRRACIPDLLCRNVICGDWVICGIPHLLRIWELVPLVPRSAKSPTSGVEHRPPRLQHADVFACDSGECCHSMQPLHSVHAAQHATSHSIQHLALDARGAMHGFTEGSSLFDAIKFVIYVLETLIGSSFMVRTQCALWST